MRAPRPRPATPDRSLPLRDGGPRAPWRRSSGGSTTAPTRADARRRTSWRACRATASTTGGRAGRRASPRVIARGLRGLVRLCVVASAALPRRGPAPNDVGPVLCNEQAAEARARLDAPRAAVESPLRGRAQPAGPGREPRGSLREQLYDRVPEAGGSLGAARRAAGVGCASVWIPRARHPGRAVAGDVPRGPLPNSIPGCTDERTWRGKSCAPVRASSPVPAIASLAGLSSDRGLALARAAWLGLAPKTVLSTISGL